MACTDLKEEFQCKNFGFCHPRPRVCFLSQCGPNWLSLVCTTVFLIYHLSWLIYDIYTQISDGSTDDELYFTKLPNWSYTMLIVTSNLVDFISTLLVHCKRQDIVLDKDENLCMPWYGQLNWLFFEISNTVAVIITIGFYGFLTPDNTPLEVEYHAINSVYVLVSFFICSKPVRIVHAIYPSIYMTIYIMFSVIYQMAGRNPPIYWILDWNDPKLAVATSLIAVFVAVPCIHLMFFGLHKLRLIINGGFSRNTGGDDNTCGGNSTTNAVV